MAGAGPAAAGAGGDEGAAPPSLGGSGAGAMDLAGVDAEALPAGGDVDMAAGAGAVPAGLGGKAGELAERQQGAMQAEA